MMAAASSWSRTSKSRPRRIHVVRTQTQVPAAPPRCSWGSCSPPPSSHKAGWRVLALPLRGPAAVRRGGLHSCGEVQVGGPSEGPSSCSYGRQLASDLVLGVLAPGARLLQAPVATPRDGNVRHWSLELAFELSYKYSNHLQDE